ARAADVPIVAADASLEALHAVPLRAGLAGHGPSPGYAHDHDYHRHAVEHPFESWFWPASGVLHAEALTQALKRLPRSVVRAKGWVVTDRHGQVLVQVAGGRVRYARIQPSAALPAGLVLIGARGIDRAAIEQCLRGASGASECPGLVLDPLAGAA
ncbi:GTP-binding protein, partial [Bordetella petrii]|uniref:GTP-binding protein n=1 Tax=Bordetella petrii TaxID=94624 RepID=UPI001E582739